MTTAQRNFAHLRGPSQMNMQQNAPLPPSERQNANLYCSAASGRSSVAPFMPVISSGTFPTMPGSVQQASEQKIIDLLMATDILPSKAVCPPKIMLKQSFEYSDVNCSPDICRCTLSVVPQTSSSLKKCGLPFGLVVHPFKDMKANTKHLSVLQSTVIVRCRTCRTYINPFVRFTDQRHWRCNMCGRVNDLPDEFHFDPASQKFGEAKRRPEIKSATVEFIAPAEYMIRTPQPACYVYVFDVSASAIETGYLETFCQMLTDELDRVPGDARTVVAFIAVDSALHYYFLDGTSIKEFVVTDLGGATLCIGCGHSGSRRTYSNLKIHDELQTVTYLQADIGGRVTVMSTVLPEVGPGALQSRENPNVRASKVQVRTLDEFLVISMNVIFKDVENLAPAADFYKNLALSCCAHQIAVDLFLMSSHYCDLATLSEVAKFSGGCVYCYPNLHMFRNSLEMKRFQDGLRRYLTRKIGFEAVLRIRCSPGSQTVATITDLHLLVRLSGESTIGS
ncbi:unnamed protein product [Soboliphyme baturini]|uniref:Vesicle coat complex copii subunit sec24/subunit sfb2 n=1 Tax=Soboliphyme baturini TaxID=241478 RepID=A0A183J7F9_9BILA|nr:unnamed protein product [Soboliphyme baturini]